MDIEKRRDELAAECMEEYAEKPYQGYEPGTAEWKAAIFDMSWEIALIESAVVEDASHLYHAPNSNAQFIRTAQPERYNAIVKRVAERGY